MLYVFSWVLRRQNNFVGSVHLLSFLALSLAACGGPPQTPSDGQETPAVLERDSQTPVDFTDRVAGQDFRFPVTINNLSNSVPATNISLLENPNAPFGFSGGSFPGSNGDCGVSVNAGSSCTLDLTLSAPVAGAFSTSLVLQYFDGLANQTLEIDFNAAVRDPYPAQLTLTPAGAIDYGVIAVGGFSDVTLTLQNTGEITASSLNFNGVSAPFSIPSTTCGGSIAAGDSCQLVLRFAPLSANTFSQSLTVEYYDGDSARTIDKDLSGEGRVAGFIAIDEGLNFDFGVILASQQSLRTLTLRNTGGGSASSINITGLNNPLTVTSNSCPATLNPGAFCTVVVAFSPVTTAAFTDALNVQFFDGFDPRTTSANFQGQGFAKTLDLSLINPVSSPSQIGTPTIRVSNLVANLRIRLYQDSACSTENTNALSSGASLDLTATLAEGTYPLHGRAEDSDGNLSSCSTDFVEYQYDITPPQPPSNITFAQSYTAVANQTPLIQWVASSSGDVVDYQVGISTNAAGGNAEAGFTSKGNVTSASETGLSLTECQYYFASVQSIDHVALTSNTYSVSATSFRYDSAVPTAPTNLNEDGDGSATNSATITWTPGTDACGVSHYEVAVSEDVNGNNILDASEVGNAVAFSNVGNVTSHRFNGINLTNGVTHFTSIRTVDTTGRLSAVSVSDPWIVYDPSIELPDMILWLDGNDPASVVDANGRDALDPAFNGQVNRWLDKSGSPVDHDFSLSSGASRPLFDDINFSVLFDGSNTGMTTPDHPEINNATVTQRNITVAFRTSTDITSRQVLYEEGGTIRGMNVYIFNNRLYCGFYNTPAGDGDGVQDFTWVSTPISGNTNYFVTWVFDYTNYTGPLGPDGDLTCYVNNASIGSVPTTSRLFAHSGNVGLGHVDNGACFEDDSCPDSDSHFLGDIFEVMLFNNAPVAADVTNVHTYLDNKWN